ncbi:hypothetical protein ACFP9V_19155 [Deinococcus radiopugnans]|uniref:Lipoprotein n=1 Tax=Deinococcus radiopugnans ATCC 19172 TaxID=585398 RepID=A0A5C4Y7Q7_9DEIO|nr:hypothetical protein [Deinococcus radiopugnans]MBB6016824.1 hypothetical protein [Deinococcus radiopugnans ATCC 19172]TNM71887.1 hypothetical protein FHR04_05840 [Deinococcus radiopugnans ATCC 19172]
MKKNLILTCILLSGVALTSCAPTALVGTAAGAAQSTQASYTAAGGLFMLKNADPVPALKIVLVLDGVTTTDPRCNRTTDGITSCRLGDVPANGVTQALAFTGKIVSGSVTWRTPEGKLRALPVVPQ